MIKNINVCGIHGKKLGMMFKKECIENDTHDIEGTLKKVSTKSGELKRSSCEKWDLPEHCFTHAYQFCEISKLYLNVEDASVEHRSLIVKELSTKISGYKRQDVEKKNISKRFICISRKCNR